jgi:hypothetical protein
MDIRYAIALIEIKKRGIANIEKKKKYNFYYNGISCEVERMQSRPKFSANRIFI